MEGGRKERPCAGHYSKYFTAETAEQGERWLVTGLGLRRRTRGFAQGSSNVKGAAAQVSTQPLAVKAAVEGGTT